MLENIIIVCIVTFVAPAILAIMNKLLNAGSQEMQLIKIEEISVSLKEYKIEQAIQALSQVNWRTLERKVSSSYHLEEWLMMYHNLNDLVKEDKWGSKLREETDRARKINQGE